MEINMEDTNVNNLNGVPNFGHGMPEDGVVVAGVTDIPQVLSVLTTNDMEDEKEIVETVPEDASETDGSEEKESLG